MGRWILQKQLHSHLLKISVQTHQYPLNLGAGKWGCDRHRLCPHPGRGLSSADLKLLIQHPLFYQDNEKKVSNCIDRAQQKSSLSHL